MKLLLAIAASLYLLAACGQCQTPANPGKLIITRANSQGAQQAPTENFTGTAWIQSRFQGTAPSRISGATVTFAPRARTAWHTHPLGQTLIITSGTGLVQRYGDPVVVVRAGDIVWIPPGEKHWHGASANESMTHIAFLERLDGESVDWLEQVTEEEYEAPPATASSPPEAQNPTQTTTAQRLMGDIAPKLAELTDKVLFGEVWARPQLSQRDRSLITVAALIAMNRPDQLRSHLARARANGLTEEELVEAITHLAFYAGWPNAVGAVSVARDVFQNK